MKLNLAFLLVLVFMYNIISGQENEIRNVDGLIEEVEIITDHWGVPHIYAQNEHDLFFAQGYYAAKDRLFQFEIWRRQATGTVAEILGERELNRDIGTRLFQFRGDMVQEMNYYHSNGQKIIEAYVEGVNAYIHYIQNNAEQLPIEFKLLDIIPQKWTPAVVISRHQGLLGNIDRELSTARAISILGIDQVKELGWFHPQDPNLEMDPSINVDLLTEDIIAPYHAYRRPLNFKPEDIIAGLNNDMDQYRDLAEQDEINYREWLKEDINDIGSNNWAISGNLSESGYPIMANDPHRRQSTPSLRYMAHLVAPGWDVIGGGEPEIPGISIGHNQHGAWGLTVFSTDAEDLYVYELHPDDPHKYKYRGQWESMTLIKDTIKVKNRDPEYVIHAYTRHGPVTKIDSEHNVAYAMRCGWLEVGGSPYLASLRMNQATNWEEFKAACNYSHIPGENMVWADREGNIGWQAVGIAPIRQGWSGMVPVPGDGRYEWSGYLPIIAKPMVLNPSDGIINTSNESVTPLDYQYWDAIGYQWSDPYRGDRVKEVLASGRVHSLSDMAALQTDYYSIPARQILHLYKALDSDIQRIQRSKKLLLNWDFNMTPESVEAGIYNELEKQIKRSVEEVVIPEAGSSVMSLQMKKIIEFLYMPDGRFGSDPLKARDTLLLNALETTLATLETKLGKNLSQWQYGQTDYKHVLLRHPLSNAVSEEIRNKLDVGPLPRGGNSLTVNNTGSQDNQPSGGSFRVIIDTGNWDHTLATNTPGQNGNPDHPHYRNLFEMWAKDKYFPLFYTRKKVESVTDYKMTLMPE